MKLVELALRITYSLHSIKPATARQCLWPAKFRTTAGNNQTSVTPPTANRASMSRDIALYTDSLGLIHTIEGAVRITGLELEGLGEGQE